MLKFLDLSGAKVCTFCRSRQELSNKYLAFTCKNWLRFSRERASQILDVIQFIYSIHSLLTSEDLGLSLRSHAQKIRSGPKSAAKPGESVWRSRREDISTKAKKLMPYAQERFPSIKMRATHATSQQLYT